MKRIVLMTAVIGMAAAGFLVSVSGVDSARPPEAIKALAPNPAVAAEMQARSTSFKARQRAASMTSEEVKTLERGLSLQPDDLATRHSLLIHYWVTPLASNRLARRAHVLWLVRAHPGSPLTTAAEGLMYGHGDDAVADPEGFELARNLWLGHVRRPGVQKEVIENALAALGPDDPLTAEAILRDVERHKPDGAWSALRGVLYAQQATGSYVVSDGRFRRTGYGRAASPFQKSSIDKLEHSDDPRLLTSAAMYIVTTHLPTEGLDSTTLAEKFLARAVRLDPTNVAAHITLIETAHHRALARLSVIRRWLEPASEYSSLSALPDREKLDLFPELVRVGARTVANANPTDIEYRDAKSRLTARYAEQLLSAAMRANALSDIGRAIYHGHMALATTDYLDGNVNGAIAHLQSASSAPPSTFIKYSQALANWTVLRRLLDVGEYNAVASFFEAISASNVTGSNYFRQSAADIRSGRMPRWYQANTQIMPPVPRGMTVGVDLDNAPDGAVLTRRH